MPEYEEESISELGLCRSDTASPVNFVTKSEGSSGYSSSPPTPTSPQSVSPPQTLKRSRSSSFRLINRKISTVSSGSQLSLPQEPEDRLAAIIGWYPSFLIRIYLELFGIFFFVILKRLPIIIPTLWVSACLWVFNKTVITPLAVLKNLLVYIFLPGSERHRNKRTVLISGGSSVQTVYLARNFNSAGARVIVCEVEGYFALARFSTAVHQFYTIPKPDDNHIDAYIEALKKIVVKEEVKYFIPVSEAHSAYYDAIAKPHIELLNCECICPEVREVLLLNDPLELMRKVQSDGFATPNHYVISSNLELNRLYDLSIVKKEPHFMVNAGMEGCKSRVKIDLPNTRRKLRLNHSICEQNPWLVVQDCKGEKYVTCTTIRDSQVVCNVTCRVDGMVPTEKPEIESWLKQFFANLKAHRKITGHFSFYFTLVPKDGTVTVLLTDCQVGVRLPYICYTSVQSRIVWKTCRHFRHHTSSPLATNNGKYWLHKVFMRILEYPSIRAIRCAIQILQGRNDALFILWDPLPYCAYYYIQLPLNKIYSAVDKLQGQKV